MTSYIEYKRSVLAGLTAADRALYAQAYETAGVVMELAEIAYQAWACGRCADRGDLDTWLAAIPGWLRRIRHIVLDGRVLRRYGARRLIVRSALMRSCDQRRFATLRVGAGARVVDNLGGVVHPVESTRDGESILVRFSDGARRVVTVPPAVIGDPIGREIIEMRRWRADPPPWRLLDAGDLEPLLDSIVRRIDPPQRAILDAVEPGWYRLCADTHRQMEAIAPDYRLAGIKQQFGLLKILVWHDDPDVQRELWRIEEASRSSSARLCEWCGGSVESDRPLVGPGWCMRLCDACGDLRHRWYLTWDEVAG